MAAAVDRRALRLRRLGATAPSEDQKRLAALTAPAGGTSQAQIDAARQAVDDFNQGEGLRKRRAGRAELGITDVRKVSDDALTKVKALGEDRQKELGLSGVLRRRSSPTALTGSRQPSAEDVKWRGREEELRGPLVENRRRVRPRKDGAPVAGSEKREAARFGLPYSVRVGKGEVEHRYGPSRSVKVKKEGLSDLKDRSALQKALRKSEYESYMEGRRRRRGRRSQRKSSTPTSTGGGVQA